MTPNQFRRTFEVRGNELALKQRDYVPALLF
jgi:hypothetical protein